MALHFSFENIKDYKTACWQPAGTDTDGTQLYQHHPVLEQAIWATLWTGISTLKEDNLEEFASRDALQAAATGTKPSGFTVENLKPFIGLTTNATTLTTAQFFTKLRKTFTEELANKKYQAKLKKAA